MKIKKLSLQNFKGRTREIDLGAVNVVYGPNWAGKTAILSAIRVGLLGYEPKLGKRPGDTFQLATGDKMQVELHFDTNSGVVRRWKFVNGRASYQFGGIGKDDIPVVPSMLLDVRDYFGLTAQQRRDHVLSMLDLSACGLDDNALLASIKTVVVEGHDAEAEYEVGEIAEEFDFWCGDRDAHETPLVEWMAGNVARLKERIGKHGTEAEQCTALLQTIAQERAANPGGTPQDQEHNIDALQRSLDELSQQYGAKTAASGRWVQRQQLEKQLSGMTDLSGELARLKGELEQARKQVETHGCGVGASPLQLSTLQKGLDSARAMHSRQVTLLAERTDEYEKKSAFETCPLCGSKEHVAKMKKNLKAEFQAAQKDLKEQIKLWAHKIAEQEVELDKLTKEAAKATDAMKAADSLQQRVRVAETAFAHVERQVQARERLIAQLSGYADAVDPGDVVPLTTRMVEVRQQIEQCRSRQKSRTILLEREAQAADAERRKSDAEKRQTVAKACLKVVTEAQQAAIDGAFGPFLATVRKFTDGVLDFALEYRDGDIGYVRDGAWVGHETFSGSEQALTYAGLGVALAARSPVKIVMLDEVLLSAKTKRLMAQRFGQLIDEQVIDQVVIVDVRPDDWQDCAPMVSFIEAK